MIEIGCQTYSLRTLRGADMLEGVRKAGFRAIELWVGHGDYMDSASAAAVRRAVDDIGIRIQAYSVGGLAGMPTDDVERRLGAAFAYASALGVDLVTGIVDRRAVSTVDGLCRRTGMRFAIENHWYAEFARPGDYRAVLADASPLVGATLDTGHVVAAGADPIDAARMLGERLFNIHLKDVAVAGPIRRLLGRRPRFEGRTMGRGEARVGALLSSLVRDGYAGRIAIEDERPDLPLSELQAAHRACLRIVRTATPSPAEQNGAMPCTYSS